MHTGERVMLRKKVQFSSVHYNRKTSFFLQHKNTIHNFANVNTTSNKQTTSNMAGNNRSINFLRDEDDGKEISAGEVLDNVDEAVAMRMRESLVLAQRSGNYKYTCAVCGQPLSLHRRSSFWGAYETWFFAHFPKSGDCPAKSEYRPNASVYAEFIRKKFAESSIHRRMKENIKKVMEQDYRFRESIFKKKVCKPEISKEYRIPDAYTIYQNREIAFDFQIYSTFIGVIADRNSFYRLIGSYLIWLFPYFTPTDQELHEKDTCYSHRRNIFVFDCKQFYDSKNHKGKHINPPQWSNYQTAYEESIARGVLCINCYWQEPVIENNSVKTIWHHKLVTIDELTFDEETKDVYYIDSDKLFYEKADKKTRELLDEWKAAKEERWNLIFDSIINGCPIGIIKDHDNVVPYKDNTTGLWGLMYEDNVLVAAKYTEVMPITSSGQLFVRKLKHWGIIDVFGHRIHQFNIKEVSKMETGGYMADGYYFDEKLHELITDKHTDYAISGNYIEAKRNYYSDYSHSTIHNLPNDFTLCQYNESDIYDRTGKQITSRCVAYKTLDDGRFIALCSNGLWLYDKKHNIIKSHEFNKIDFVKNIAICETRSNCNYNSPKEYYLISTGLQLLSKERFTGYKVTNNGTLIVEYQGTMHNFIEGKGIIPIRQEISNMCAMLQMGNRYAIEVDGERVGEYIYSAYENLGHELIKITEIDTQLQGVIDQNGETILPCIYNNIKKVSCQIDEQGCLLLNKEITDCVIFAQKQDDKNWYAHSSNGELYRSDEFASIAENEEKLQVRLNYISNYSYTQCDKYIYSIYNGILPIRKQISDKVSSLQKNDNYALEIDGEKVSDYTYEKIEEWGKGLIITTESEGGLHKMLDYDGKCIIPEPFDTIKTFDCCSKGLEHLLSGGVYDDHITILFVHIPNGKRWTVYTSTGKLCRYDYHDGVIEKNGTLYVLIEQDQYPYSIIDGILPIITEVQNGLCIKKLCGKYALTDTKRTTGYIFSSAEDNKNGYIKVSIQNNDKQLFGLYTYDCTEFLACVYTGIKYLREGGFAIQNSESGRWGVYKQDHGQIIPFEYDYIKYSTETGMYIVSKENNCELVDSNNETKVCYPDGIEAFHVQPDGITFVKNSNKEVGICNAMGAIIVEVKYFKITALKDNLYVLSSKKTITEKTKEARKNYWGNTYYKSTIKQKSITENCLVNIHNDQVKETEASPTEVKKLLFSSKYTVGQAMSATVISRVDFGLFVRLSDGLTSLLPKKYLKGMNIDPNNVPL